MSCFCITREHPASYVYLHEDVCFVTTQSTVISQIVKNRNCVCVVVQYNCVCICHAYLHVDIHIREKVQLYFISVVSRQQDTVAKNMFIYKYFSLAKERDVLSALPVSSKFFPIILFPFPIKLSIFQLNCLFSNS